MKFVEIDIGRFVNFAHVRAAEVAPTTHVTSSGARTAYCVVFVYSDGNFIRREPFFNTEAEARAWLKAVVSGDEQREYEAGIFFPPATGVIPADSPIEVKILPK